MTALDKYSRLEGPGAWRSAPSEQRRNVVVSLGDASLMISDTRSGTVLSHWSLPAVQRLNRGTNPALFAPGPDDSGETLEIDDATLIEALATIRAALTPPAPKRWIRTGLMALSAALVLSAVFWLPSALETRTARIVPPAMRAEIGREALASLTRSPVDERLCSAPAGLQALNRLSARVLGDEWRVSVVFGIDGFEASHLSGQLIVLGDDLLQRLDSPEALTGWLLAQKYAALATDPLLDALSYAGVRHTLTLLTTGTLPQNALDGYAAQRLRPASPLPESTGEVAQDLAALHVSPLPFAASLPETQDRLASELRAYAADLRDTDFQTRRLISDGMWLTLQAICAE